MKANETILSAYGSHNASVCLYHDGNYQVVEVERWLNSKNAGLTTYLPSQHPQVVFDEICEYLLESEGYPEVDMYLSSHMGNVEPNFDYKKRGEYDHHTAHAAVFYQTDYEESIAFTFDGGGDNGFFNVYHVSRKDGIKLLQKFDQDLGFAYMILADYLHDIKKDPLNIGNLVYAGKLMGLCSYGNVREEWLPAFDKFYETFNYVGNSYLGGAEARFDALTTLFKEIDVPFNFKTSRFKDQLAWDIAATTQKAFENQFYKFADPYLKQYSDLPICMSGGCALNVLLNADLNERLNGNMFVPPNTSDCGIAIGGLLWYQKPEEPVDLTYSGLPIMDTKEFSKYLNESQYDVVENVGLTKLASLLNDGMIIGVVNGNSEHGPRALGNRSILCKTSGNMKDVINEKVKNREWYRPFAPIVQYEDANTYFNFENSESRHMTYVATIREPYLDDLKAVCHNDKTGRLQTVKKEQNTFIHDLLTEYKKISGVGVLLNTSFNVDGKPILTRLSDAFEILNTTKLDGVYYDGKVICKKGSTSQPKEKNNTCVFICLKSSEEKVINQLQSFQEHFSDRNTVMVYSEHLKTVQAWMTENRHDLNIHIIDETMLYHNVLFNLTSLEDASRKIKYLWVKNVINENINNSSTMSIYENGEIIGKTKIENLLRLFEIFENKLMNSKHQKRNITQEKLINNVINNNTVLLREK